MTLFMRKGISVFLLFQFCSLLEAADYFVSNFGNDANDGLTTNTAWATLAQVNTAPLVPGDRVLFQCGGVWRGCLNAMGGASGQPVTYTSYGVGAKPLLLGSVAMTNTTDWMQVSSNIWEAAGSLPVPLGANVLSNPSFDTSTVNWTFYVGGSASASMVRDTTNYDTAPASVRLTCTANGTSLSDLQFFTGPLAITNGVSYTLQFAARASKAFTIPQISMLKNSSPWTGYASWQTGSPSIGTNWSNYIIYFTANTSASDARISFNLGTGIPNGATLNLDSLSFRASSSPNLFQTDVGNIILNGGAVCGIKKWNKSDLSQQNQFWFDQTNVVLDVYSSNNPALLYTNIECAGRAHIININNVQGVVCDGLAISCGGAHGISAVNATNVIVRNCNVSFIGGGNMSGGTNTVRYGNGIQFWANATNILVERCRLWQIYDAALTAQSTVANTLQTKIEIRNNLVQYSEYSFEFWNRATGCYSTNVIFEYNTCLNAGGGWGHGQRPDPNGRHLMFWSFSAVVTNCLARHNIFSKATDSSVRWNLPSQTGYVTMDYNCYNQSTGYVALIGTTNFAGTNFGKYQSASGQDAHSFFADPQFDTNYCLLPGSPCIDAALMSGWSPMPANDLAGVSRPLDGNANGTAVPDMGCFEFASPNADTDHDGMNDADEVAANTDPANSSSILAVRNIFTTATNLVITWQGGIMATQFVERCLNLSAKPTVWTTIFTNYPPTLTSNHVVVSVDANPNALYRVKVSGFNPYLNVP